MQAARHVLLFFFSAPHTMMMLSYDGWLRFLLVRLPPFIFMLPRVAKLSPVPVFFRSRSRQCLGVIMYVATTLEEFRRPSPSYVVLGKHREADVGCFRGPSWWCGFEDDIFVNHHIVCLRPEPEGTSGQKEDKEEGGLSDIGGRPRTAMCLHNALPDGYAEGPPVLHSILAQWQVHAIDALQVSEACWPDSGKLPSVYGACLTHPDHLGTRYAIAE
ncbi:hypothetical protein QBC37DRAFT_395191 [Rhypophila decipiens]|uniref:Uncharacterized protein n=1 Tax=Rhypophila decipiens TaxID=261697 RepID=A0AAN7BAU1_9PEZI|nr:hypothetical protein QBC37DRAFT_395191 [Rhypophila decipiens]